MREGRAGSVGRFPPACASITFVRASVRVEQGRRWILPAIDAAALVAFTLLGVASHDHGRPLDALARVGVPLLCAWFAAAWAVGTYRAHGVATLLAAWAVSVPIAVVVRTVVAGRPWDAEVLVFLGVALAFTLLFLVVGRGVARVLRLGGGVGD
jgi:hypothetical protein